MPATLIITRPAFTDSDSIPSTTFNGVTIVSAIIPDATAGAEGVIRLAGDLTGGASAPVLVTTGVTAGTYGSASAVPVLTIDAKGRVTAASVTPIPAQPEASTTVKGLIQIGGDLTGNSTAQTLVNTAVTPGTYGSASAVPVFTVDAKGRVTGASTVPLPPQPDASTTVKGLIQIGGDLTGNSTAQTLVNTAVTPGTYGSASAVPVFTIDAKGRVTGASTVPIPTPPGLPSAWAQFDGNATTAFRVRAYSRAANIVTITDPGHTWRIGDRVSCDFTSGGAVDGLYTIEGVTPDEFTFTLAGANTGGNVTLEIYQLRNVRNVHSIVADPRYASASYWVNFQTALANDTFLTIGTGEHFPSSYAAEFYTNTTAGVRAQDTRGVSIRCTNAARNIGLVIFGG